MTWSSFSISRHFEPAVDQVFPPSRRPMEPPADHHARSGFVTVWNPV